MVGFVTTRHLFTHSAVIVSEFGTVCLLRCLWRTVTADHAVTFLECTVPIHGPVASLGTPTSLDVATGNKSDPAEILFRRGCRLPLAGRSTSRGSRVMQRRRTRSYPNVLRPQR